LRRNSGFWLLVAIAVGVGGAFIPEKLSGGSAAMTFILLLVYTLAGAVLVSYLNSRGVWRWAVAIFIGTLLAQVFLAIPETEPLTRNVITDAFFQQRANLAAFLAEAIAAAIGCMLGAAMSGGK